MARHLMVDLETLAVSPNTVVLTLGAVTFDPHSNEIYDDLYFRIDLDDQDKLGREIDDNTVEWWGKQDPKIMEEAFGADGRINFEDAVSAFHKFAWGCDAFWSHGSTFDLVIINDMYKDVGKTPPWQYWAMRDTRTLFDIGFTPDMPKGELHNALADAKRQAVGVQNVYRKLRELRESV